MADKVVAKNSDSKFKPHPEGSDFLGLCVDVIDLGETVAEFAGKPKYLAQKCAVVFRTGERNAETGDYIDISAEFTVSMGEKANLRKFLEQWRGKPYTDEQIDAGVPVDKLVGQWALLAVAHKKSAKGNVYGIINSATGVPKQIKERPEFDKYTRGDWWEGKKNEYAKLATAYRAEIGAESAPAPRSIGNAPEAGGDFAEFADTTDYAEDEDLPF